ncbi:DNA repair and recombination protein RAD22 [Ceratobasidium sp. AG-Ba]|nr:DNA repair and recombination protein RAD22 [Ceratobasidium sp. AG-Ba]
MSNGPNTETSMTAASSRVLPNYTAFWDKNSAQDGDAHKQNASITTRMSSMVLRWCYRAVRVRLVAELPLSRFYKGEAFLERLARHEHYLASMMGLKPGMRVLDVGCGVGGPAREIARFTDANITGLNNNDFQIGRARKYTEKAGLSGQVQFVKGDFMKLSEQFGEGTFDAVYAIEATVHAPTWEGVYGEIKKVLKPGGIFGVYEWCMTDDWDPSIPEHKDIAHGIEVGDGIPEMRTIKQARQALKNVGFEILHEEDLADRPDPILETTVRLLEMVGLVPKGTYDVGEALKTAADALVRGGQKKLFTPMYLVVSRKPVDEIRSVVFVLFGTIPIPPLPATLRTALSSTAVDCSTLPFLADITMNETSMSMNHALSSHLLESFDQSRRAATPAFGTQPFDALATNFSSADQLAEMQAKLNKKLGPDGRVPAEDQSLLMLKGGRSSTLQNEVFGFNGWSSSVLSITTDYIDYNEGTQRYNVGVSAVIRVTLRDGAFHEDVGFGSLENARGKGMALDKCKKEAVTDGLKRTLRNFGNLLGNCLYDKQYASEILKIKAPVLKLDKDALHRRPDLAGPVPTMPIPGATFQSLATSSPQNQSVNTTSYRPVGNPSPLATSTPITNRAAHDLPTPDTSLENTDGSTTRASGLTNVLRRAKEQGVQPNASTSADPSTSSGTRRASSTLPASVPPAPGLPQRRDSETNLFDHQLAGELAADGSVYGSEDDAFFDNIMPGELDMEVAEVPPAPAPAPTEGAQTPAENASPLLFSPARSL